MSAIMLPDVDELKSSYIKAQVEESQNLGEETVKSMGYSQEEIKEIDEALRSIGRKIKRGEEEEEHNG